jgi:hypothetical protein
MHQDWHTIIGDLNIDFDPFGALHARLFHRSQRVFWSGQSGASMSNNRRIESKMRNHVIVCKLKKVKFPPVSKR